MNIGIVGNTGKPSALEVITEFARVLTRQNVSCIFADDLVGRLDLPGNASIAKISELGALCSVVISFGGDGTILSTAKEIGASGTPILGVNVGTLGFLTEVLVQELEETVIALIENRYTITDRMVLHVRIGDEESGKNFYAVNDVVIDRGSGIPAAAIPYLFKKFSQLNTSETTGGVGLGLYISKQIVEAHDGRIWTQPTPDGGATFCFTLPLSAET